MLSFRVFVGLHSRTGFPHFRPRPLTSSISFRINTCKSVSKQTTLTPSRMNTYEKHRGVGVLLLTTHPTRIAIPPAPDLPGTQSGASRGHEPARRGGSHFSPRAPLHRRGHGVRMVLNAVLTPHRETSPLVPVSKSSRADAGCGRFILPIPG